MKKQIVFFCFMLLSIAGFSQMSKTDAAGFLTRNPIEKTAGMIIWNGSEKTEWAKEAIVSLKSLESGFSLVVNQNGVEREKFYPYAALKFLSINGNNQLNAELLH